MIDAFLQNNGQWRLWTLPMLTSKIFNVRVCSFLGFISSICIDLTHSKFTYNQNIDESDQIKCKIRQCVHRQLSINSYSQPKRENGFNLMLHNFHTMKVKMIK